MADSVPEDATLATRPTRKASESAEIDSRTHGRYAVLELLGVGAMGEVFRAYDPKLRREVALKRLHAHWLNPHSQARLVREAHAMAQLSHPNVVAIYDVEIDEAGVTLVMEYVSGQTLKQWLARPHGWEEIVAVFCAAARGLAAAHAVGFVHRDFKPANVLLACETSLSDGVVEHVKVADLGLVKASHGGADESGVMEGGASGSHSAIGVEGDLATLTEVGTIMGTPRYMAPEQHEGAAVDSRADQYSWCVALWEALTGEQPFSARDEEMEASKRAGPKPWPRPTAVPEAIIAAIERGLAPEPDGRWPSMQDLLGALDVERRPPNVTARRIALATFMATVAAVGGAALWTWYAQRAALCSGAARHLADVWNGDRKAEVEGALLATRASYADVTAHQVSTKLDAYAGDWIAQHDEACKATTVRGEQSTAVLDLRMACLHKAKIDLEASVEVLRHADEDVLAHAVAVVDDLRDLSECADLERLQQGDAPAKNSQVAAVVETLRVELAGERARMRAGKVAGVLTAIESLDIQAREAGYPPFEAEVALALGDAQQGAGHYGDAVAAYERAMSLSLRHGPPRVAAAAATKLTFVLGSTLGDFVAAAWLGKIAVDLARNLESDELESSAHSAVAASLQEQGKYSQAEAAYRQSLALRQAEGDLTGLDVARIRTNLANVWQRQGRYKDAAAEYRAAIELFANDLGPDHPHTLNRRNNLANSLVGLGDYAEAEREYRTVLSKRIEILGPGHPVVASSYNNLGAALHVQRKYDEAEQAHRRALQLRIEIYGTEHAEVADSHSNLGDVYMGNGQPSLAEQEYRLALEVRQTVLGLEHPEVGSSHGRLGHVLSALHRPQEALVQLERAWATGVEAQDRGKTAFLLARLLWKLKPAERRRAWDLASEAAQAFRDAGAAASGDAEQASAWLAAHRRLPHP